MNCNLSATALRQKISCNQCNHRAIKTVTFSCRSIGNQSAINRRPVGDRLAIGGRELSIKSATSQGLVGDLAIGWWCAAIGRWWWWWRGEGWYSLYEGYYICASISTPFFRSLENSYSFDPYILAKMRKMSYFDPYFSSKLGKMYSLDPQLRSWSSSYSALAIWKISWRFDHDLCDQVAICLRSELIATDLCARESTDGDLGDHGDQSETNQRSISDLEDLSAPHGALTERHRSPPIVEWGYNNHFVFSTLSSNSV